MKIILSTSGNDDYLIKLDKFLEAKKKYDKALAELQQAQPKLVYVTDSVAQEVEDAEYGE